MAESPPLLVIVGPTASGKSSLGLEVAETLGGEIISADAFAVYRGLDIGTDKPDREARQRVRHHLIDVTEPDQRFSAGDFTAAADAAIESTLGRGDVPVVVGGTHFYVRALILGLFPSPPRDPSLRARLEALWEHDPNGTFQRLEEADPDAAAHIAPNDRQRVLRALEVWELTGVPLSDHWRAHQKPPRYRALLVQPRRSRGELYARINTRVDMIFASGLVDEVSGLLDSGIPRDAHALKAIGYREVVDLLDGRHGLAAAIACSLALPAVGFCAKQNIQVHGGIGYTWEHDAHLYLRRAIALESTMGPVDRAREDVVALDLHLVREAEQRGDRRQEHGRGLAAPP